MPRIDATCFVRSKDEIRVRRGTTHDIVVIGDDAGTGDDVTIFFKPDALANLAAAIAAYLANAEDWNTEKVDAEAR